MGGLSIWHIIGLAAVFFLLFGGKFKFSDMMGDVAKGIKSFKQGMSEDDSAKAAEAAKSIDNQAQVASDAVKEAGKIN
ncbi:MAG: twin-arginine translocase TatA/TatE family subunit [Hyphomicrobiales bacterium]|nr:twin-arginine translocase TatA/TatE family subunit [Hyphomicrobiales bacterium]MDE2113933.1 twin-arginine translocase TatA/TatE family subunit [Hyphomicrobiales bacterium]